MSPAASGTGFAFGHPIRQSFASDIGFHTRPLPEGDSPTLLARGSDSCDVRAPDRDAQSIRLASLESVVSLDEIVPLTLSDADRMALERNPDLAAVRAAEPVAHAAFHVAETYPWNPQFQTQVLPYSRDRTGNDGTVSQQHVIVQTFELGGQQRFRVGAAAANWEQVNGTIRQAELINAAQTTRFFFAALYLRELRDMSQSLADLNEQLVGVMQRREKAGQANNADVQLARLQSQSSRRQQRLAEANYQTALMNLRNQLNLDANASLALADQWLNWRWRSLDEAVFGDLEPLSITESADEPNRTGG